MSVVMELERLKRIHDSTNESVKKLERRNEILMAENKLLEAKNKQLILRLETQDRIVHQTLENSNRQSNEYLEEINTLRGESHSN